MGRRLPILAYGLGAIAAVAGLGASLSISSKSQLRAAVEPWLSSQTGQTLAPIASAASTMEPPAPQIGAVGLVEPSSQEISIGTEISGTVSKVFAIPGVRVSKGDPLFVLDTRLAEAVMMQRLRDQAAAEARLSLATISAREGDLDGAVAWGRSAYEFDTKPMADLLSRKRDLDRLLRSRFGQHSLALEFHDYLASLHADSE